MGSVYLASDLQLNSLVALKLLKPFMSENDEAIARFLREFQITRQVTHKNVVRTYDIGLDRRSKVIYFTMEYIKGESLGERLRRGRYPLEQIKDLLVPLLNGLDEIHRCGIIHRDLKPSNILIAQDGVPKIADFGIARPQMSNLTQSWEIVGSASYLAPELWQGEAPTAAVDFYALGISLYEMATGKVPFQAESQWEFMKTVIGTEATPPQALDFNVPGWLNRLVIWLLNKIPKQRPASVTEILQFVEKYSVPTEALAKRAAGPKSSSGKHQVIKNPAAKPRPVTTQGNILIVDDDRVIRNLLQAILEAESYTVFSAPNGREAVNLLQEKQWSSKIDYIFLDVQMPEMDGHEVLSWLRSTPHTTSIPVIMLTSLSESEQVLEGYASGADYYITKPFTKQQLLYGIKMLKEGEEK